MYSTMHGLVSTNNWLKNYIELAKDTIKISPDDFGIPGLRNSLYAKDAESVLNNMHTINTNVAKYKVQLTAQGMTDQFAADLIAAEASIAADKQLQYEIASNRSNIAQANLGTLNALTVSTRVSI
jgi:hypothetical protein